MNYVCKHSWFFNFILGCYICVNCCRTKKNWKNERKDDKG